jgi:hypothetical protein
MNEYRDAVVVSPSPAETAPPLTFDKRWAQSQAKGARHDVRVARNMRLIAAITLTIGVIWPPHGPGIPAWRRPGRRLGALA